MAEQDRWTLTATTSTPRTRRSRSPVGQRLRAIRQAQGMSLADVEERSRGGGARRRSARTSAASATCRCPGCMPSPSSTRCRCRCCSASRTPCRRRPTAARSCSTSPALAAIDPSAPIRRFVQSIIEARGDFNGKVLSLRHDDLKALCTLVGGDIPTGVAQLRSWGVMIEGPEIPESPVTARERPPGPRPAG